MDVQINEMTSTVRVTDSEALLNPQMVEKLVRMLMDRIKEHEKHEKSVKEE